MTAYLRLTDAEWQAILPHLPRQRSGPRRQNDRETVTAFLFAKAAGVSLDCLPDCGFPNPLSLRTTWQRWRCARRTRRGDGSRTAGGGADGAAVSATHHRPVAAAAAAKGDRQALVDDAALEPCAWCLIGGNP